MAKPIDRLARWLAEKGYAFAFVNSIPNVFYLSGFYCDPHERLLAVLVFPDGPPLLVCPEMEISRARGDGWQQPVLGYTDIQNPWEMIGDALRKRVGANPAIAVEIEFLPLARAEALQNEFPGSKLVPADTKLQALRSLKTPAEVDNMREAARLADRAMEVAVSSLAAGVTEVEVAAEIEHSMRKLGAPRMAFSTIVLFGPRSAMAHGVPGKTPLKPGDLVLIDLGVVSRGYCSDITRTFAFKDISPEFREIYQVNLEAQLAALAACRPGNPVGLVDQAAREVITRAGYAKHTGQRVGHGIGIQVHEYPSMTGDNEDIMQPGLTFTVEPGLSFEGAGGFRIEDDVLIMPDGCEILTKFPKELQVIT